MNVPDSRHSVAHKRPRTGVRYAAALVFVVVYGMGCATAHPIPYTNIKLT
ncbi:hypothetical protein KDH_18470 [Dictyobacter sp. S3.2.2.5]|uniref:Uncharacterized protein n=1 Tax=Dictyobacter halimunensis TaxID=3026934 RepID=A0ABQ6FL69_9CHLR|nr:hypothetical protein KDH_18470 [Dictyobacter sp. S3.2.2.5]